MTSLLPEEKLERGRQAQLVLDSPAYQSAVQSFTQDIRSLRLALGPRDVDGAYRLVLMEQAVEKAKRLMEGYMRDANAARAELEKDEGPGPVSRWANRLQRIAR
jgi:hypothetical protein